MSHKLEGRRQFFKSIEAKSLKKRSFLVRIADDLTAISGSPPFLFLHVVFFLIWILINTGYAPQIKQFDPYPFGLLTMVVSLEAIFLSIFVLVAQNRSSYVGTIRDEVHMQINLAAEREITKILEVMADIRKKVGIVKDDPELTQMLERTDANYIEQRITEQLEKASKPVVRKFKVHIPSIPDLLATPVYIPGKGEMINGRNKHGKSDSSTAEALPVKAT